MEKKTNPNRRTFIKSSGSLALGLTALNYRQASAKMGPNSTIRMGCIGVGGMGTGRLREFLKQDDATVVAVCDVDSSHAEKAASITEEATGRKATIYKDFRELLEKEDVDAVTVTTPDHWHALIFVEACKAGKDVFHEKPLSHSLKEGRYMADAAKKYGRITQMGNHIHAGKNYRDVVRIVRSGVLGMITRVQVWKTCGLGDIGNPADTTPPAELDYNFWLGPAPKRDYNPNRSHFNFRFFWDYSGGYFADFWCHISDIAYWALDLEPPTSVSAIGGRYHTTDNAETPNTLEVQYDHGGYPLTFTLNPSGIPGFLHMGGIGCMIQGTKGTIVTNYSDHEVYIDNKKIDVKELDLKNPEVPPSPGHVPQFLNSMRTRVEADCNVQYAHKMTKGMHLGVIAYKTGDRIEWDDEKEKIIGNSKANRMLMRRYRRPWKIKV